MTHENRFGMFIHWGIYALTGLQDQAFVRYNMPRDEYEALMHRFDPVKYDPEEWVLLAKEAGMKYICFTTKHHDGFCMWDTKYSDYSIMHTPYGKDVLKMLADACHKHGMGLSLYYSIPDWHHPKGFNPNSTHQWRAVNQDAPDFEPYREYIRNQVTELLTNYGKIYTFFWDIPPKIDDPSMNALVRRLQPGILINNRGFDAGDFSTPEREYQSEANNAPYPSMTEACNSIDAQSWGYRAEADFYSYRHVLSSIDRVMARGGSYLLNIGPTGEGNLAPDHSERIRRVGKWYRMMEGCLECHESDPFDYRIYKSGDCIVTRKDGKSYFHFYNGTLSTAVMMKAFPNIPKSVRLMNTHQLLDFKAEILPEFFSGETGRAEQVFLHIRGLPVDDLASEPIVIEVTW